MQELVTSSVGNVDQKSRILWWAAEGTEVMGLRLERQI